MKRFALLAALAALVLALVACSSPAGGSGSDFTNHVFDSPGDPVPDFNRDPSEGDGGVADLLEMRIASDTTVINTNGSVSLSLKIPTRLEDLGVEEVSWKSSELGVRPGEFSPPTSRNPTWSAGASPGEKTLTATVLFSDGFERSAEIIIYVTKNLSPRINGPAHIGFFNPTQFSVVNAGSATVTWSVTPDDDSLKSNPPQNHSVIWNPPTWRSGFYTITATLTDFDNEDPDAEALLHHEFSTSFCSQGRTITPEDPCGIENIHQLAAIHYYLDGHFALLNDIDATDTKDWNTGTGNGRYGFWPIGADPTQDPLPLGSPRRIEATNFSGTFDGGKHTISNLHIVWPGSIGVGLFGFVHKDAVIKDVYLSKATVVGYEFVGGIAGRLEGIITGSSVTDSTISFAGHGRTCSSQPNFHQGDRVGGLVGLVSSGGGAVGDSYALRTDVSGCAWVGGLAGIIGGEVMDSYSVGGTIESPTPTWRGGFTGQVSSSGQVARTFSLMAGNVAYTGLVSDGALVERSYWSSDYPGAAVVSDYAIDKPAAQFPQIISGWGTWQLKNDGPAGFTQLPDLVNNPR